MLEHDDELPNEHHHPCAADTRYAALPDVRTAGDACGSRREPLGVSHGGASGGHPGKEQSPVSDRARGSARARSGPKHCRMEGAVEKPTAFLKLSCSEDQNSLFFEKFSVKRSKIELSFSAATDHKRAETQT